MGDAAIDNSYDYEMEIYERQNKIFAEAKKTWNETKKIQLDQDMLFDKSLISLSGGSFGISFAFINLIIPLQEAVHTSLIIASWACFAASLIITLLSLRISSVIHGMLCAEINKSVELSYEGKPYEYKKNWIVDNSVRIANWISLFAFIGGVVCLILFVYFNLR